MLLLLLVVVVVVILVVAVVGLHKCEMVQWYKILNKMLYENWNKYIDSIYRYIYISIDKF